MTAMQRNPVCSLFGAIALFSCTLSLAFGPVHAESATVDAKASATEELEIMKADNKRLRALIPSQSHSMADVGYHFANLWFAGQAGNWPLAQFYLGEVRNHIKWSIRLVPVRKTRNGEVNLTEKFEPFDSVKLAGIQEQIAAKDRKQFGIAYRDAITGCNDCHTTADKPYLHVTVPHRAVEGIEFAVPKGG